MSSKTYFVCKNLESEALYILYIILGARSCLNAIGMLQTLHGYTCICSTKNYTGNMVAGVL